MKEHDCQLAVAIRQLFSSSDPYADSEDNYLYCVHIAFTIQIASLSFPMALLVSGTTGGPLLKFPAGPLNWLSGVMKFSQLSLCYVVSANLPIRATARDISDAVGFR